MDDRRLLRFAGLALPAAVWVLGIFSPRPGGLDAEYAVIFTALLAALTVLDQRAPGRDAPLGRRLHWLAAELALCYFIVRVNGSLVRPTFIYLLPAVRALLMFEERPGLALSLLVWPVYCLNILDYAWPDRLHEFRTYLVFFLAPYVVGVVLTLAALRQAADRRRVQALYDELHAAHQELQRLHRRARETAVTEERNRLAREIHDSLAHYLTVINVQLEAAEKLAAEHPQRADEQVRRARRLTLDCLKEVRRSVAALRASSLDELALPRALEKLAADFARDTGIEVRLIMDLPDAARLPPDASLALYRVAQEGLTNVHRHARARTARLTLGRTADGGVELAVQDDGAGPPPEATENGGFGLLGLRERVELLGGRLGFEGVSSGGSRLTALLPVGEAR